MSQNNKSWQTEFITRLNNDESFREQFQKDPEKAIRSLPPSGMSAYTSDLFIYRFIVIILGLTILTAVGGSLAMQLALTKDIPTTLLSFGSAALGALAGLLAPSPMHRTNP